MKNILKIIAVLTVVVITLPSCKEDGKINYAATETAKTVATLAEDTSSEKAPSRLVSQESESERPQQSSQKPQEQSKEEVKREAASSASESINATEYLKVENREYEEMEEKVVRLMNEQRAAAGLKPLKTCDTYYASVQMRAEECTQYWSHTRPNGQKFISIYNDLPVVVDFKMVGENLGKKFVSAEQIVTALMNSEPHRRNILRPEYTDVCVAVVMMDESEQVYSKTIYAMAQHFYKKEELK